MRFTPGKIDEIVHDLLDTDLLTANHDGTPEHYIIEAENVEQLVHTVLGLAFDSD